MIFLVVFLIVLTIGIIRVTFTYRPSNSFGDLLMELILLDLLFDLVGLVFEILIEALD